MNNREMPQLKESNEKEINLGRAIFDMVGILKDDIMELSEKGQLKKTEKLNKKISKLEELQKEIDNLKNLESEERENELRRIGNEIKEIIDDKSAGIEIKDNIEIINEILDELDNKEVETEEVAGSTIEDTEIFAEQAVKAESFDDFVAVLEKLGRDDVDGLIDKIRVWKKPAYLHFISEDDIIKKYSLEKKVDEWAKRALKEMEKKKARKSVVTEESIESKDGGISLIKNSERVEINEMLKEFKENRIKLRIKKGEELNFIISEFPDGGKGDYVALENISEEGDIRTISRDALYNSNLEAVELRKAVEEEIEDAEDNVVKEIIKEDVESKIMEAQRRAEALKNITDEKPKETEPATGEVLGRSKEKLAELTGEADKVVGQLEGINLEEIDKDNVRSAREILENYDLFWEKFKEEIEEEIGNIKERVDGKEFDKFVKDCREIQNERQGRLIDFHFKLENKIEWIEGGAVETEGEPETLGESVGRLKRLDEIAEETRIKLEDERGKEIEKLPGEKNKEGVIDRVALIDAGIITAESTELYSSREVTRKLQEKRAESADLLLKQLRAAKESLDIRYRKLEIEKFGNQPEKLEATKKFGFLNWKKLIYEEAPMMETARKTREGSEKNKKGWLGKFWDRLNKTKTEEGAIEKTMSETPVAGKNLDAEGRGESEINPKITEVEKKVIKFISGMNMTVEQVGANFTELKKIKRDDSEYFSDLVERIKNPYMSHIKKYLEESDKELKIKELTVGEIFTGIEKYIIERRK